MTGRGAWVSCSPETSHGGIFMSSTRLCRTAAKTVRASGRSYAARLGFFSTVSGLALFVAGAQGEVLAQTTPQAAQAPQVEEIVVTGTRIIRDGYEAPTPL